MDWLKIFNKNDVGEVHIYGMISDEKWFDEDVTPGWFKDQMAKLNNVKNINMYINSPGGGVFPGLTIYNMINRLSAKVTAYIDGLAASIASVLVMAADTIIMPKNAMMMIHDPFGMVAGTADEMRKYADLLDRAKSSIVSTYVDRTKKSEKEISDLMAAETWMNGEEAVKLGFADILEEAKDVKACLTNENMIVNGVQVALNSYKSFPRDRFSIPTVAGNNRYTIARQKFNSFKKEFV